MRKNLCWLVMAFLVFASINSGCGGSSSSPISNNNTTQSQDVTPNNPTSPDNTPTPNTPTSPDNTPTTPNNNQTTTTIPFTTLEGTWQASNGTGTWTGTGINATVSLSTRYSNTITFSNVNVSGNTATFEGSSQIEWDAYQNGARVIGCEDDFGGGSKDDIGGQEDGGLKYTNTGGNTWRMERTNGANKITRTVITFTSATTAQVERFEDRRYQISVSYKITKQ